MRVASLVSPCLFFTLRYDVMVVVRLAYFGKYRDN